MHKPAAYTTVNHLQRRDASDFFGEFVDDISKITGRCLDIGSGPGDTVVDLILPKLNKQTSLVCSDISEKMLNFAKNKYKGNARLSFVHLNIESPDLPEDLIEQFDQITSFYCLHWCRDMCQVFDNIFNLLKPGGTAFLTILTKFAGFNTYTEMAAMPRYQPYMKDAHRYIPVFKQSEQPEKNLKALIKDAGFEVHHCSIREKTYTFDNPDMLRKFMVAVDPFIERIPANLKEQYKEDLVKGVAERSIVFNKNNDNENEHSILWVYEVFLGYIRKPLTASH